jgi:uncharacterized protein
LSDAQRTAIEGKTAAMEAVEFRGHPMVRSTHPTTIEITTEDYLTENGDCIIGVGASKGCAGLGSEVKEQLRKPGSLVTFRIVAGPAMFEVRAAGDPRLTLSDPHEMVIRKSNFISDRTVAVNADAASRNIPRNLVRLLKNPATEGRLEIEVR